MSAFAPAVMTVESSTPQAIPKSVPDDDNHHALRRDEPPHPAPRQAERAQHSDLMLTAAQVHAERVGDAQSSDKDR